MQISLVFLLALNRGVVSLGYLMISGVFDDNYFIIFSRAQLFKTNTVVSQRIINTFIIKYSIYTNIFAEKNVSSFCICKSYSHFFSKNTCELEFLITRTVNILSTNELIKLMML